MSEKKPLDLGLTSVLDELFMDEQGRAENRLPKIYDIPLSEIDDFPEHPFYVRNDEDMDQLVESIKERGIITPVMLRQKDDGRFEMVSGHRRKRACELAGMDTIKAEIRNLTRDDAILLMVDSNLQRTTILPSEKAFAYKMRLDAMRRQGERTDLTSDPVGWKLSGKESASVIGELSGDSGTQVRRFVRLTNLISGLLELVDEGRIALRPAVELSYLTISEQKILLEAISYEDATPSLAQAIKLREFSANGRLDENVILSILREQKPNQREKISFHAEQIRKYIPDSVPSRDTEKYVLQALDYYRNVWEKNRQQERDAR